MLLVRKNREHGNAAKSGGAVNEDDSVVNK